MAGWLDPVKVAQRLGIPADAPYLPEMIDAACRALELNLGYLDALTGLPPPDAPPFPDPPPADMLEAGYKVCSNLQQNPSAYSQSAGSTATGFAVVSADMLAGTERLTGPYRLANSPVGGAI
jgi:hypothetical protein